MSEAVLSEWSVLAVCHVVWRGRAESQHSFPCTLGVPVPLQNLARLALGPVWEAKAGRSQVQGLPGLQGKFMDELGNLCKTPVQTKIGKKELVT